MKSSFGKLLRRIPAVFLASYGELSEARINTGLDIQNECFKITAKLICPNLLYLLMDAIPLCDITKA